MSVVEIAVVLLTAVAAAGRVSLHRPTSGFSRAQWGLPVRAGGLHPADTGSAETPKPADDATAGFWSASSKTSEFLARAPTLPDAEAVCKSHFARGRRHAGLVTFV